MLEEDLKHLKSSFKFKCSYLLYVYVIAKYYRTWRIRIIYNDYFSELKKIVLPFLLI